MAEVFPATPTFGDTHFQPVSSAKWTLKVSSLIILGQLMKGVA